MSREVGEIRGWAERWSGGREFLGVSLKLNEMYFCSVNDFMIYVSPHILGALVETRMVVLWKWVGVVDMMFCVEAYRIRMSASDMWCRVKPALQTACLEGQSGCASVSKPRGGTTTSSP